MSTAWIVEIHGLKAVVFAETRAKAKWIAVQSYWEAFNCRGCWPNPKARRAKQYDDCIQSGLINIYAYNEDYASDLAAQSVGGCGCFRGGGGVSEVR